MIKRIHVDKLLGSNNFVLDPVSKTNKLLSDNQDKNIILTGGRGSGKTVVLNKRELDAVGTSSPAILTRFDAVGMFTKDDDKYFGKEFLMHYYELVMSNQIVNYIKKFYPVLYQEKIHGFGERLDEYLSEVDTYINKVYYIDDVFIEKFLKCGEFLGDVVNEFKKEANLDLLTLMVDRFDWTNNGRSDVQHILSNYFGLFDRTIITSDDETLNKDNLAEADFVVHEVDYGRDPKMVREIVERRIKDFFSTDECVGYALFPYQKFSDECYKELIEKTDGNLDVIFNTIDDVNTQYQWTSGEVDVNQYAKTCCDEQVEKVKNLRKISSPIILHL